jgi:hypothetical protein
MKRKGPPVDVDFVFFFKFFNTPGNEITPGSDVIGKNFQYWRLWHIFPSAIKTYEC